MPNDEQCRVIHVTNLTQWDRDFLLLYSFLSIFISLYLKLHNFIHFLNHCQFFHIYFYYWKEKINGKQKSN